MVKLSKLKERQISIDGIIGSIYQERMHGECEFISRKPNSENISVMRVASVYLKEIGDLSYTIREPYKNKVSSTIIDKYIDCLAGSFQNGKYLDRDFVLKNIGL